MKTKFNIRFILPALVAILLLAAAFIAPSKPVFYIIGDSTTRNSNRPQCGWGEVVGELFDTTRISISNQAMAGRSTRTFISEGRWDKVMSTIKAGDYFLVVFGHNEGSAPDTTKNGRRGVLKGIGEETKELTLKDGSKEVVHTYGWYLRKFVNEAKSKGAIPIIASMIPRNEFRDGKVMRAINDYGKWSAEVAAQTGTYFVDMNSITSDKYDKLGPDETKKLFPGDHTHTNIDGARINAASVTEGLRMLKDCHLKDFLLQK
jgi:lysophospholipase L1-like esterase